MANKYGALAVLALFLCVGGAISYDNITNGESSDVYVTTEEPTQAYMVSDEGEVEVDMYYYAAETYDGILVPLAFASEIITEEDEDQFALLTDTIFPQIEYAEADKGAEMLMLHINRNRTVPVFVEVIRVSK